jgi:hypothetical protein
MIDFAQLAKESHATAVSKGWYEKDAQGQIIPRDVAEVCSLFHSEISEAVEELRKPNPASRKGIYFSNNSVFSSDNSFIPDDPDVHTDMMRLTSGGLAKPEGVAVELADLIIRLADSAESWGVATMVRNENWHSHAVLLELARLKRGQHSAIGELVRVHQAVSLLWSFIENKAHTTYGVIIGDAIRSILLGVQALCVHYDWNLERAIKIKMTYNDTRPFRHGGKLA